MKERKCKDMPNELWPPKGSIEEEKIVYRLLRKEACISSDDFISVYEIDKKRNRIKEENINDDSYYGISLFEDIEDALSLQRKSSWKFKDIAKGVTKAKEGCIRMEPSRASKSHLEWWLYENATPENHFVIIRGHDDE